MALTPQTIGLNMSHGFSGSYARQPDMIVNTAPLGGTEIIPFGTPLVRGENGAVLPMGTGNTGNQFIGVAGREVKSPAEFFNQNVGQYAPEEPVSVFQRGCINVKCQKGSPSIDGTVYIRVTASGNYVVGGFEAEADGANTVALSNAQWNGPADNHGVAELRIAYVGPVPSVSGSAGEDGGYYQPSVSEAGELTWTASKEGMPAVASANNHGPAGTKRRHRGNWAAGTGGCGRSNRRTRPTGTGRPPRPSRPQLYPPGRHYSGERRSPSDGRYCGFVRRPHTTGFQQSSGRTPHSGDVGEFVKE